MGRRRAAQVPGGDSDAGDRQQEQDACGVNRYGDQVRGRQVPTADEKQTESQKADRRRQGDQPGIEQRVDDHRDVVVEGRLAAIQKGGNDQQRRRERSQAEAHGVEDAAAARSRRRQDEENSEDRQIPDDEREDDMDDQALVEEGGRPRQHRIKAGHP